MASVCCELVSFTPVVEGFDCAMLGLLYLFWVSGYVEATKSFLLAADSWICEEDEEEVAEEDAEEDEEEEEGKDLEASTEDEETEEVEDEDESLDEEEEVAFDSTFLWTLI